MKGETGSVKGETISVNFWQGKVQIYRQIAILARQWWRHFRLTTSVSLLPSHYFRLTTSVSLSLSPIVPHAQYRKRFRASYNNRRLKRNWSLHTCTPPNSIQFRKFTKPPSTEASTFFLSIIQFPPSAFSSLSSIFFSFLLHSSLIFLHTWHIPYSLFFYLSYMEQVFYIVHCNFVYFCPLGDPLDQGLVPVGE